MTLEQLRQRALAASGNDLDDLDDLEPQLTQYVNEGYDRLLHLWRGRHVGSGAADADPLRHAKAVPDLPDWAHPAVADWAAWQLCQSGSGQRRERGLLLRERFEQTRRRLLSEAAQSDAARAARGGRFIHLPQ